MIEKKNKNSKEENDLPIHFIGLGGAGSNMVEFFHDKGIKAKYTCISDPIRNYNHNEIEFINFVPPCKRLIQQGNESIRISDMSIPIEIPTSILEIFNTSEKFVLFAGLGGYTGTYMTIELSLLLKHLGKSFSIITSEPFAFESEERQKATSLVVKKLDALDNFTCLPLEEIRKISKYLSLKEAFEIANERMFEVYLTF